MRLRPIAVRVCRDPERDGRVAGQREREQQPDLVLAEAARREIEDEDDGQEAVGEEAQAACREQDARGRLRPTSPPGLILGQSGRPGARSLVRLHYADGRRPGSHRSRPRRPHSGRRGAAPRAAGARSRRERPLAARAAPGRGAPGAPDRGRADRPSRGGAEAASREGPAQRQAPPGRGARPRPAGRDRRPGSPRVAGLRRAAAPARGGEPPSPSGCARCCGRGPATCARPSTGGCTPSTTPSAPSARRSTTRSASRAPTSRAAWRSSPGARVKIGYQAALKLLRAGATVVATTRFPHDAARRYAAEPDFADWSGRLRVYGLDLRHSPSVEIFCSRLERRAARAWTCWSTTPARPCAGRRASTSTCSRSRRARSRRWRRSCGRCVASHHDCVRLLEGASAPLGGGRRRQRRRARGLARRGRRPGPAPLGAALAGPLRLRRGRAPRGPLPRRRARRRPPAGRPAGRELVAPDARGRADAGDDRGPARQRRGPLHPVQPAQAADAARAGPRQAHRQRLGDGGRSSRAAPRPTATRTRTWPRRRSTC